MQIEGRIASREPRNISLTKIDAKNYHEHNCKGESTLLSPGISAWDKTRANTEPNSEDHKHFVTRDDRSKGGTKG